jgi:hypothetical protein
MLGKDERELSKPSSPGKLLSVAERIRTSDL